MSWENEMILHDTRCLGRFFLLSSHGRHGSVAFCTTCGQPFISVDNEQDAANLGIDVCTRSIAELNKLIDKKYDA